MVVAGTVAGIGAVWVAEVAVEPEPFAAGVVVEAQRYVEVAVPQAVGDLS